MKMTIDMPLVSRCSVQQCAYNQKDGCHARAITVGDRSNPNCDTYFENPTHSRSVTRIAGVGACKVVECRFNADFECSAQEIDVGMSQDRVQCLTFESGAKPAA
jgi:hypothetical protein